MASPVKITFLGGLGEIGRNCTVLEHDDALLVIDFGIMFPGHDMPGVDLVLADFRYLTENAERVVGCVLTHGHEDHVGGLAYLLAEVRLPLYGSPFTLALARNRIEEAGLVGRASFHPVADGERVRIGPFDVEFVATTHSVPSGNGLVFRTPQGVIVHSGDFKLDSTPVDGRLSDLARLGAVAHLEGVRVLLADSTNAEEPGWAASESSVGGVLYDLFHEHRGRRIVTVCFASHIHRIQQIADAAVEHGRMVTTLGLSMKRNVRVAREMGLLDIPSSALVDIEDVADLPPGQVCIISTGSQGEPYSALSLMAANENRFVKITGDDTVILSSTAIPGNESNVNRVVNGLVRLGAEVVHTGVADVHSTGHARQEELKLYHSLLRPQWFVPIHGEARHLAAHASLAETVGLERERIVVADDGDQLVLDENGLRHAGRVPAGHVFVDGIVGDVGRGVLRDRRALAAEGVVVVIVVVDLGDRVVVNGPEVITRGWVYAPEAEDLLDEAGAVIRKDLEGALSGGAADIDALSQHVRRTTARFVNERTRRRPMIVPVVLDV
jgi:ribonuclease J